MNDKPTSTKTPPDEFTEDLERLLEKARTKHKLTYSEAIGVLEMVKSDLIEEARRD